MPAQTLQSEAEHFRRIDGLSWAGHIRLFRRARIRSHPAQVVPETVWVHDPAIKAAVLVAPAFSRVFEPSGLSRVTVGFVQGFDGDSSFDGPIDSAFAYQFTISNAAPEPSWEVLFLVAIIACRSL